LVEHGQADDGERDKAERQSEAAHRALLEVLLLHRGCLAHVLLLVVA
jgi:hypothetical protein